MRDFAAQLQEIGELGIVEQVQQSSAIIKGLPGVSINEMVLFETGQLGEVFLIEKDYIQILTFSNDLIRPGTRVTRTNKSISTPVGSELLGSIIDPLGISISQMKNITRPKEERVVDNPPPGMLTRARIKNPFLTGITIIDTMVPLGKGQKELIIGDRKTGKTSIALAAIKNQVKSGSLGIYAAIGKRKSDIKKIEDFFSKEGITDRTIIVATTSFDSPSLIFLTPYSAMTIAEYFRDQGQDTVVVLDDLSTHARFYREISLLAKRFPGREAYPGDIFYTHARLLERTGNFKHEKGEVSITTLPVAEIVEGDFTSYIATNLMGITDGHIYFDSNVYYDGRRPAVNIPLSVTRVGRQAQSKLARDVTRHLSAFLANYEKMQTLAQFGAELTGEVKETLQLGSTIYKSFQQSQSLVIPLEVQLLFFCLIWLKSFGEISSSDLSLYRENLVKSFNNKKTKLNLESLLKVESFKDFQEQVSRNKERLVKLCKTGNS